MQNTPSHFYVAMRRLAELSRDKSMLPVFASSSIGI